MSSLYGVGGPVGCGDWWASDSSDSSDTSSDEMQSSRSNSRREWHPQRYPEGLAPGQKEAREKILRAFQQIITSPEYLKDQVGYVKQLIAAASNNLDYEFIFPEFGVLTMLRELHNL